MSPVHAPGRSRINPEKLTHVLKENGYLGNAVVEDARLKLSPYDWIPKLEKAFAAFDDLDCAELLGPA